MLSELVSIVSFLSKDFFFLSIRIKNRTVLTHFVHRCVLTVPCVSAVIAEQLALKSHIFLFRFNACLAPAKVFDLRLLHG